jgi:hypothetical protein
VLAGQLFSEVDSHLHDRGDRTADRASRYLVSSVGPIAELVTALDHVAQLAHIRLGGMMWLVWHAPVLWAVCDPCDQRRTMAA